MSVILHNNPLNKHHSFGKTVRNQLWLILASVCIESDPSMHPSTFNPPFHSHIQLCA